MTFLLIFSEEISPLDAQEQTNTSSNELASTDDKADSVCIEI